MRVYARMRERLEKALGFTASPAIERIESGIAFIMALTVGASLLVLDKLPGPDIVRWAATAGSSHLPTHPLIHPSTYETPHPTHRTPNNSRPLLTLRLHHFGRVGARFYPQSNQHHSLRFGQTVQGTLAAARSRWVRKRVFSLSLCIHPPTHPPTHPTIGSALTIRSFNPSTHPPSHTPKQKATSSLGTW